MSVRALRALPGRLAAMSAGVLAAAAALIAPISGTPTASMLKEATWLLWVTQLTPTPVLWIT